jgi:hypothetical protein
MGPAPATQGTSGLLAVALAAAFVAGAASWLAGEAILKSYEIDLTPRLRGGQNAANIRRFEGGRVNSAAATFAVTGGFLGLALGLAGGIARRSASAGSGSAILGLLLGAAAPAVVAKVLLPIFFKRFNPSSNELMLSLLTVGAIWLSVGAAGGLAFGVALGGRGRWKATLVGGIAGAAVAAIVYEIAGALAFPAGKTDLPLATSLPARAMAHILVAILTAAGAVLSLRGSQR